MRHGPAHIQTKGHPASLFIGGPLRGLIDLTLYSLLDHEESVFGFTHIPLISPYLPDLLELGQLRLILLLDDEMDVVGIP